MSTGMDAPLARLGAGDASGAVTLVLCLPEGASLAAWASTGVLRREWILFEQVYSDAGDGRSAVRLAVMSWGEPAAERAIAAQLAGKPLVLRAPPLGSQPGEARADAVLESAAGEVAELSAGSAVVVRTVQMHGARHAAALANRLRLRGVHTAFIARAGHQDCAAWTRPPGIGDAELDRATVDERAVAEHADLCVVTTDASAEELARTLGGSRLRVLPNHVPPEATSGPLSRRSGLRCLTAGRLTSQKNVSAAIEAMRACATPGASLTVAGDGELWGELTDQAEGARVRFVGRLTHEELLEQMRTCAIYVQCSHAEGQPKAVLEAMACGCPVIVTEAMGIGESVEHGRTGLVVPPDPASVAMAIDRLLGDPDARLRMGAAAAAEAAARFGVRVVAGLERGLHAEALAAARRAGRRAA